MSSNNQILYIISALAASEKAMYYAKKYVSSNIFFEASDQMPFNATLTLLMAVGEEIKKIDKNILETQLNVDWQKLKDMRNFLAHDYRGVDYDIVFDVVKVKLPKLSEALITFLHLFPKADVEEAIQNEYYKHLHKIIF